MTHHFPMFLRMKEKVTLSFICFMLLLFVFVTFICLSIFYSSWASFDQLTIARSTSSYMLVSLPLLVYGLICSAGSLFQRKQKEERQSRKKASRIGFFSAMGCSLVLLAILLPMQRSAENAKAEVQQFSSAIELMHSKGYEEDELSPVAGGNYFDNISWNTVIQLNDGHLYLSFRKTLTELGARTYQAQACKDNSEFVSTQTTDEVFYTWEGDGFCGFIERKGNCIFYGVYLENES